IVFIVGSLGRLALFFAVAGKRDKPIFHFFNLKYVILTWLRYLFPFNQTVAKSPVFSLLGYAFHFCLIFVPIFIIEHVMYWEEETRFGWSWWSMPDTWAYYMTLVVIVIGVVFFIRRLVLPHVRIISTFSDFLVIVVTILPFLTGWLSVNFAGSAFLDAIHIRLLHILSGELMLILIPFTKLSHFLLFFPSRMVISIEWGRRGYSA
ncbi:MAG: nitrate reductase, partial [Proteobacteria bacterium]|nr:nitrate reductase [Pseudomonadota bacterium]